MDFIDVLKGRLTGDPITIVYPEGDDVRIVAGACEAAKEGICVPVLLGNPDVVAATAEKAGVDISGIKVVDPAASDKLEEYVAKYAEETHFPAPAARVLMKKAMGYGAAMTRFGDADACVAGAVHRTSDVIQNCRQIIGMEKGIKTPSSCMIMNTPHFAVEEGNAVMFADPGVNSNPTAEQLADIAITTARTTRRLLGWEPRIAMLSFSTKGSARHADVDKVIEALNLVKEREPDLLIDGELQLDAAVDPDTAKKKIPGGSPVAGRANVLVFPDLDAANIAFKLVQHMGDAGTYGPFLQGFAKPASDLSRGCAVGDVIGVSIMAALDAKGRQSENS